MVNFITTTGVEKNQSNFTAVQKRYFFSLAWRKYASKNSSTLWIAGINEDNSLLITKTTCILCTHGQMQSPHSPWWPRKSHLIFSLFVQWKPWIGHRTSCVICICLSPLHYIRKNALQAERMWTSAVIGCSAVWLLLFRVNRLPTDMAPLMLEITVYVLLGFVLLLSNVPPLVAILWDRELRIRYAVLAALLFPCCVNGWFRNYFNGYYHLNNLVRTTVELDAQSCDISRQEA